MAKVILEPIGRPREQFLPDEIWSPQLSHMNELNGALESKRGEGRDGWGDKYRQRVRAKGKLTAWDRIEKLSEQLNTTLSFCFFHNGVKSAYLTIFDHI